MKPWFDRGHDAFSLAFPQMAEQVPFRPFYVCPLCLHAYSERHFHDGALSREDVPPKSVGGRKIVLTCRDCNSTAGHDIDWHVRKEADVMEFVTQGQADMRAHLRTSSRRVPIQLNVSGRAIKAMVVPEATRKSTIDAVNDDFGRAAQPDGWQDFEVHLEFDAFSPARAATSWLRSAYLLWFAELGYRFILRPELDIVRERIKNPDAKEPGTFRIIEKTPAAEPTLVCIDGPEPFRSYAMLYGRHVILLPRYDDHELYSRLATHPECHVNLSGTVYPWPDRPLFVHDFLAQRQSA
jgi:hypothetical protein